MLESFKKLLIFTRIKCLNLGVFFKKLTYNTHEEWQRGVNSKSEKFQQESIETCIDITNVKYQRPLAKKQKVIEEILKNMH